MQRAAAVKGCHRHFLIDKIGLIVYMFYISRYHKQTAVTVDFWAAQFRHLRYVKRSNPGPSK